MKKTESACIATLVSLIFLSSAAAEPRDWRRGFEAPVDPAGPQASARPAEGPPMDPQRWQVLPGEVLTEEQVWGMRVKPRAVIEVPGGLVLAYTARSTMEDSQNPDWRQEMIDRRLAWTEVGSLAFTTNLFDWQDHPDNPLLNEAPHPWQGGYRVHLQELLYDPQGRRWVAYFGDRTGRYPGMRAVGVAYSQDLIKWEYVDRPVLTLRELVDVIPTGGEPVTEIDPRGRIYVAWVIHHEDRFYVHAYGSFAVGDRRVSGIVTLVGDSPEGPFELAVGPEADHLSPDAKPVHFDGKWYRAFAGRWDGQRGVGLAMSDNLLGPYERNPANPVFTLETTERINPLLFHYNGVWGVLFTRGGHWSRPLPLRMAIADFDPAMIEARD